MGLLNPLSKKWRWTSGILFLIFGIFIVFLEIYRDTVSNYYLPQLVTGILFIIIGLIFLLQKKEPLDIGTEMKKMNKQDATLHKALKE